MSICIFNLYNLKKNKLHNYICVRIVVTIQEKEEGNKFAKKQKKTSPVTCHLSPVTCLALVLSNILVKTVFMLKPVEATAEGNL